MTRHPDARRPAKRRPYSTPTLKIHGDLKTITMAKGSNKGDGGGKPATRSSGGPA